MHDHDIARLLGPAGKLSRLEKEAIFDTVAAGLAPALPWWRRGRVAIGAACAIAGLAVLAIVLGLGSRSGSPSQATLAARGEGGATMIVRCGAHPADECASGDRLTFDFGSTPPQGNLGLFARAPDGTIVWYLPGDDATPTLALAGHTPGGVLDTVVELDRRYTPGRYQLFAIVSDVPMTRADIRALAVGDRLVPRPGVNIVDRTFVVRTGDAP